MNHLLLRYIKLIVEPTFEDLKNNPLSPRHTFLACMATYHAIDRAAYRKHPGNIRKDWCTESVDFFVVDVVTHHIKHVLSDKEEDALIGDGLLLASIKFDDQKIGPHKDALAKLLTDQGRLDIKMVPGVVQNAIRFLLGKAGVSSEYWPAPV